MMDSREKFEAWWNNAERQRIDDLYIPSKIAEAAWLAGRESMRDEAVKACFESHGYFDAARKIEEIKP